MEQNWSDRQLEEATAFDDRVKYALGMGRSDPPLDATTLCRHRRRLLENDYGQKLFDRVVQQAKAEGFLSSEATVRLDSFLITGAAARQDTYTLLRRGILRLLTLAQCHGCRPQLEAVLERADLCRIERRRGGQIDGTNSHTNSYARPPARGHRKGTGSRRIPYRKRFHPARR